MPLDERLKHQAERLEALLDTLVKPPGEHEIPDIELSHREVRLLIALDQKGEAIMSDLAAALRSPLSTVTRMVDRLETKGLAERSRPEHDRRVVIVRPSARARVLSAAFHRHQFRIACRMLEPLSPAERELLLELMAKMSSSL